MLVSNRFSDFQTQSRILVSHGLTVGLGVKISNSTVSLLPIDDFCQNLLAEDSLPFGRAELICSVLFRPVIIFIDDFVVKAMVYLLELLAELA